MTEDRMGPVVFEGIDTMHQFVTWFLAQRAQGFIIEVAQYYYPQKGRLEVSYEYEIADQDVVSLALLARSPANE